MLDLLKGNPLHATLLHQVPRIRLQFLPLNVLISNGAAGSRSGFTVFSSSSSSSSSSSTDSKNVVHESPKRKELIFQFFRSYGFTDAQVERFMYMCPSNRSIQTYEPKLEYLLAYGFSPSELVRVVCFCPNLLANSLEERIKPNLSRLEAIFGSKKHIIKAVSCLGSWLLSRNLEKNMIPNLEILRENSMPMENITRLFTMYPRVFDRDPKLIMDTISKLKGLSISPSALAFIHGMNAMITLKKETWERKMKLYQSFGWSEEDTLSVISENPNFMLLSDNKITEKFKFYKEKLQWDSDVVLRWPALLGYSLDDRLVPRCAVLNVLAKKGLWNGKPCLRTLFTMGKKDFKERFVDQYEKEVPQVVDAYQGKIDFVGFESMVMSASPSHSIPSLSISLCNLH